MAFGDKGFPMPADKERMMISGPQTHRPFLPQHSSKPGAYAVRAAMGADEAGQASLLPGRSAAADQMRLQVSRLGRHYRVAVIQGERGVRKGRVATALHLASPSGDGVFQVCNLQTIEALQVEAAQGRGELREVLERFLAPVHGGTLFFPDLDEMPGSAQAVVEQLLEMVETPHGERIRVIASTQRDLETVVANGGLSKTVANRLAGVVIRVAPLRDRKEDIPEIARAMLKATAAEHEMEETRISAEAIRALQERSWPGNVRELESVIRMAALASNGDVIEPQHLPAQPRYEESSEARATTHGAKLQDVIEAHVLAVLKECDGNKLKTAEVLGISRSTLYRMLEAVGSSRSSQG
jgi:DNA-binding NtrC family response regulator